MVLGSICKCFHHCQCHTPYFSANFFGVVLVSFFVLLLACWAGCFLHLMTLFWTLEGLLKSPSSSSLGGIITRPLAFGKDRGKTETVPQGDFLADAKKNFPCFFGLSSEMKKQAGLYLLYFYGLFHLKGCWSAFISEYCMKHLPQKITYYSQKKKHLCFE